MQKISHILVGLVLFFMGMDKAAHFHEHPKTVLFLFAGVLLIILGTVLEHRIAHRFHHFPSLFHVVEGIALILISLLLFEKESRITAFQLFLGGVYLLIGVSGIFITADNRERVGERLRIILGWSFVGAGFSSIGYYFFRPSTLWIVGFGSILLIVGVILVAIKLREDRLERMIP